jgi:hypothetical protein
MSSVVAAPRGGMTLAQVTRDLGVDIQLRTTV